MPLEDAKQLAEVYHYNLNQVALATGQLLKRAARNKTLSHMELMIIKKRIGDELGMIQAVLDCIGEGGNPLKETPEPNPHRIEEV
ncbi:MAG: hypothetical protein K0U84_14055 [Actinomycetia bacterium]|nr:hypothetical protein [Actinomycetes bacterium]